MVGTTEWGEYDPILYLPIYLGTVSQHLHINVIIKLFYH